MRFINNKAIVIICPNKVPIFSRRAGAFQAITVPGCQAFLVLERILLRDL
jgi:hypothetical protein